MDKILEMVMLLCFGAAWPANVIKSYKVRTTKGKSITFLVTIMIGYIAGIARKIACPDYVLFFYILNIVMVSADILLYIRNKRLDRENAEVK